MKNKGSKNIITDRLELRAQTINEQKYLWEILMIPEVNKYYLAVPTKFRENLKDWKIQEKFYTEEIKQANDLNVYKWSIFLKNTETCIGRLSCQERSSEDSNITDSSIRGVGWYIDPKYQHQGYATEAAKAMIDYMFKEVEINEIITGAAIINIASWKIMEKLGFERQLQTDFVQYTYLDNLTEDYRYILTKEMYLKTII
ncbi:MAG TPA: GNAT family N-acetyltransferase [Bacilli bacterium]|nr:GNAT family N-acetyltransferase [Bacilli bacterium]HQC83651.1 GNAT family N-acetyltransferase [Bacilli bacterium]